MDNDRTNRLQADEETYKTLLSHGADPEKEHLIDFYFVGDEKLLSPLEGELLKQGYTKFENNEPNTLLVKKNMKLALMESHIVTESLETLATEFGVKFDGWGTVAKK